MSERPGGRSALDIMLLCFGHCVTERASTSGFVCVGVRGSVTTNMVREETESGRCIFSSVLTTSLLSNAKEETLEI